MARTKFVQKARTPLSVSALFQSADVTQDPAELARRVRQRLGLTQAEFSEKINVSIDTIRNWEQGKRSPSGAAKSLLKILDALSKESITSLH